MNRFLLTKEFRLEMAHALVGYDGPCSQIHGHSYRLEVTIEAAGGLASEGAKMGMAIDFSQVKRVVERAVVEPYDHSLLIRQTAETEEVVEVLRRHFDRIHAVAWQPTSENMLSHFASLITPLLPEEVRLHSLRLHETDTNCAELLL